MKNLVLVTSSNRNPERHTARLWQALRSAGAVHVAQEGSPDVAFARNMALTWAVELLQKNETLDVVLMMDDDMVSQLDTVQTLAARAIASRRPCSGVYATQSGHLAATRWKVGGVQRRDADGRMLWLVGLGCLAIPRAVLLDFYARAERFTYRNEVLTQFCWTKAESGEWWAEDYVLSRNLGGVRLEALGFGHVKKVPLWADAETLQAIASDEGALGPENDAAHVRHLDELFPGEGGAT